MGSSKELTPTQTKLILFGVGALALVLGTGFMRSGWTALHLVVFELPSWQEVPALVTESDLEESTYSQVNLSASGSLTQAVFRPHVRYTYEFDGRSFTGDRWQPLDNWGEDRETQQAVVDRFPVGHQTTALVNPDDPASAVLERGDLETPTVMAGMGAFFALAGVGILIGATVFTLRSRRNPA